MYKPQTWEYARLNIAYTVLSKRRLNTLVMKKHVEGWDDPRLLTLAGLRRRGYSSETINKFCEQIGVTRADSVLTNYEVSYTSLNAL
ncbi:Glutamyl/glutaminyl-tRNA synthetase [Pavlovales sp. CCMP2436]|nr:Glutamyl/glutaminyl-tRNA synthetase [Pavlovales sp. CCMP2436]